MKKHIGRAGAYKTQKSGQRAFVPKPLPPDPPLELDNSILNLLSKASLALGRLDGITEILPNPDLFVLMYLKKEAVLSSQIEGTQASLIDVLEFEAKTLDPKESGDVGDVVNYIVALNYGLEHIRSGKKISLSLLNKLHHNLLKDTRGANRAPGKLRTMQNWIGPPDCDISEATFIPPDIKTMTSALRELEVFINSDDELPSLIKAGMVHSQFETIHPFLDGNGRIGRLLLTLLLVQSDHISRPLLYLSYYFKKNRIEYYGRLQAVRDNGDWEGWLRFFLDGIYHTSTNAVKASRKIIELRKNQYTQITEQFGNRSGTAIKLFEELFNRPIVTVSSIVEIAKLSYPNANSLAAKFEELGILKEVTGQKRNRIYEFVEYMDILNENL